jgi:acetoin utilization protein AcuC
MTKRPESELTNMKNLVITFSDIYLNWQLGAGHPTNPVRAKLATEMLVERLKERATVIDPAPREQRSNDIAILNELHDPHYVAEHIAGNNSGLWGGNQPDVAEAGLAMFEGTVRAVELILSGEAQVVFNPQGAKHHAKYGHGAGFCAFNDMAYAAIALKRAGLKVLYIDWDIHAGDGVFHMLKGHGIPTISIHNGSTFPVDREMQCLDGSRTDVIDEVNLGYNFNVRSGDGDDYFMEAIDKARAIIDAYQPDVILLAAGADGHTGANNLGVDSNYTAKGFKYAAEMVAEMANKHSQGRVIIGGAGGYQPFKETPETWALVVSTIYDNVTKGA